MPYANLDEILTSLDGVLSSLGVSVPTALPTDLDDIPGFNDATTTAADGRPAATGSPQNGGGKDNAARGLDVGGSFRGLGAVAVGGVAMLCGAGWLLI
jgi:hypothetical protein